jgi:hypothetical protein
VDAVDGGGRESWPPQRVWTAVDAYGYCLEIYGQKMEPNARNTIVALIAFDGLTDATGMDVVNPSLRLRRNQALVPHRRRRAVPLADGSDGTKRIALIAVKFHVMNRLGTTASAVSRESPSIVGCSQSVPSPGGDLRRPVPVGTTLAFDAASADFIDGEGRWPLATKDQNRELRERPRR